VNLHFQIQKRRRRRRWQLAAVSRSCPHSYKKVTMSTSISNWLMISLSMDLWERWLHRHRNTLQVWLSGGTLSISLYHHNSSSSPFFSRFWIGAADEVQSSENISITYYKGTNLSYSLYSFQPLFYQVLCFSASMLHCPINPPSTTSWTFRSSVHGLQCLTSALCLCAECVLAWGSGRTAGLLVAPPMQRYVGSPSAMLLISFCVWLHVITAFLVHSVFSIQ
jgi:hypothetical protein